MKNFIVEFLRRGMIGCGFGPLVLGVVYLILHRNGAAEVLAVNEVYTEIFTISALAFIAGGLNALYQIDRLPLAVAILIHGAALYLCYLVTYLVNGWLDFTLTPILVFTGIFLAGYLAIWAVIYSIIRKRTATINEKLRQKQNMEN